MIDKRENAAYEQLKAKTSEKFKLILRAATSSDELVFNHSWIAKKPGLTAIPAEKNYWKAISQREDATQRAMSFSSEYIATEASKSPLPTFPNSVIRHFESVSDLLDQKLPEGPRGIEMRRAYLAHVEELLPSSAHWKPEVQRAGAGKLSDNLRKEFPRPEDLRNRETGYGPRSLSSTRNVKQRITDTEFAEKLTSSVAKLHYAIDVHTRTETKALRSTEANQAQYSALETRINALPEDPNSRAFEGTKAARHARYAAAEPRVFREYLLEGNLQLNAVAKTIFQRQQDEAIRAVTPARKRPAEPFLDSPNTSTRAQATPGPWIKRRRVESQSEISLAAQNDSPLPTASQRVGDADAGPSRLPSTPPSVTSGWITRPNAPSLRSASQISETAPTTSDEHSTALDNREGERVRSARSVSR